MDEDRFSDFYSAQFADVWRFARRRTESGEDADDVTAETFAVAWRRRADIPADAGRLWLFGVARNVLGDQARGWSRRRASDVRIEAEPDRVERDGADGAAARVDLARAWRELSAADREVLALVAFDGLTAAQAAEVLGCRRSAFAMRLGRARTRLTLALDPTGSGELLLWTGA